MVVVVGVVVYPFRWGLAQHVMLCYHRKRKVTTVLGEIATTRQMGHTPEVLRVRWLPANILHVILVERRRLHLDLIYIMYFLHSLLPCTVQQSLGKAEHGAHLDAGSYKSPAGNPPSF